MSTSKKRFIFNKRRMIMHTVAIIIIVGSIVIFFTTLNATQPSPISAAISQTT